MHPVDTPQRLGRFTAAGKPLDDEHPFATVVAMEGSCQHCEEPVASERDDRATTWARCGSCGQRQRVSAAGGFRWPALGSDARAWARSLGADRPDV